MKYLNLLFLLLHTTNTSVFGMQHPSGPSDNFICPELFELSALKIRDLLHSSSSLGIENFMLSECNCRALMRTESHRTPRVLFEDFVSRKMAHLCNQASKPQVFSYVTFGSGFLFLDLMILGKFLLLQPNAADGSICITIHAIDPMYDNPYRRTGRLGEALMDQLVSILRAAFKHATISGHIYSSHAQFNQNNITPNCIVTADIEAAHIIHPQASQKAFDAYMSFLQSLANRHKPLPSNYLLRSIRSSGKLVHIPVFTEYFLSKEQIEIHNILPLSVEKEVEEEQECC